MISEKDKMVIMDLAFKYHVSRIFLFGSSLTESDSRDIDLGVEGLDDSLFFKFYGELLFNLSKPVDLIDLRRKSKLRDIVLAEGIQIHG
jgi:uncharacterized protein